MKEINKKVFWTQTSPLIRLFFPGMLMLAYLTSVCYAQPPSLTLHSVSVLPSDSIQIKFKHTGDEVNSVLIKYIPFLEDYDDPSTHVYINIIQPFFGEGEIRIENPADPSHEGALHFVLLGEIDGSAVSATDYHSTIFLEEIESISVACELGVHASWMNYAVFTGLDAPFAPLPFDSLQILISDYDPSNSECRIENEVVVFQTEQSYWDDEANIQLPDDISPGSQQYCFRVRSYSVSDPDLYAYSNMITGVQISELDPPDRLELVSADVINNEHIEVRLKVDDFGFGQFEYRLFRSNDISALFTLVPPPKEHDSQDLAFIDETMPDLQSNPWFYYVEAIMRECPDEDPVPSNTASSIFLQAQISPGFDPEFSDFVEINLSWEHDPAWDEYVLKRQLPGGGWQNVPDFDYSAGDFSFTDEIELADDGISVFYLLEADKAGVVYSIHSNMVTIEIDTEDIYVNPISVPHNALRPGSDFAENKVFLPEQFDDPPTTYNMSIYDRNGLLVFSTGDHQVAWDGTINGPGGQDAPAGAYIYQIKITDRNGDQHENKGVVYLVR